MVNTRFMVELRRHIQHTYACVHMHTHIHTWNKTKFTHRHSIVWFLVKKTSRNIVQGISSDFSFQDTCHHHMAQAIKWLSHACHIVIVGVSSSPCPFQGKCQCTAQHSVRHALTCCHSCLKASQEIFDSPWEGLRKHAPSGVLTRKNSLELDVMTKKAMKPTVDIQSTFLDIVVFSHCQSSSP